MKRFAVIVLAAIMLLAGAGCSSRNNRKLTINADTELVEVYREAAEKQFSDVGAVECPGTLWVADGTRYLMVVLSDSAALEQYKAQMDGMFLITVYDGGTGDAEVTLLYSIGDSEASVIQRGGGTISMKTAVTVKLDSEDPAVRAETVMGVVRATLAEAEGE